MTGPIPPVPDVPEPAVPPVDVVPPVPPVTVPPVLVVPPAPGVPPVPPFPHVVMQAPPHGVVPAGHAHEPLTQLAPLGHGVPHAPQLRMSLDVFVHRVSHWVWPHVALQTPFEQKLAVGAQTLPQLPQLFGSPCRFKHEGPQAEYGGVHAHFPAWQNCPIVQA